MINRAEHRICKRRLESAQSIKMKKVWIINHYAAESFFDKGGRHYWFAKYLKRAGYEPVVFVCNAKHGIKEQWIASNDLWIEKYSNDICVPFVFVKASLYSGNGKDRIANMFSFYKNVKKTAKEYAKKRGKPDIILASSVHPLTMVAGIKLAKFFGVKCIGEVRDLWPESIFVYSNKIKRNSLLGRILLWGEKWIYKKTDSLIFTMPGGADYIKEHGWDKEHGGPIDLKKVYHINNGVDLEVFDDCAANHLYKDSDLDQKNIFKVVYAGSIRRVNKIGILLDAAKQLCDKSICFYIFGDGDERDELQRRVEDERIENVFFKGRVDKKLIPSITSRADLNVVHWKVSPLIKYGDSSNKSFEYYAAGRPVLYTTNPAYGIVEKYGCGITIADQNSKTIASAIMSIYQMSQEQKIEMCKNARKAAVDYDFKNLTIKLINIIENG